MNSINQEIEISLKNEENDILIDNKDENQNNNLKKNNINGPLLEEINKKDKNIIYKFINLNFVFHFFIINCLFAIIIIIIYIFYYNNRKPNFKIIHYDMDTSYLNDRKYENYIFDNGLEVMIIQDKSFDRDGGAIVIEKGILDNPTEEGIPSVAAHLLYKCAFNDEVKITLNDYYGKSNFGIEHFYTNFRFDILNNGFKKFLYYFSLILNPKNITDCYYDYIENIIEEIDNEYDANIASTLNKEIYLLENLVFGLSDYNNSKEILPEGNKETLNKYTKEDLKVKVFNYIENLLIDPSKIKIVLFSKYKILLTAKYTKKYFHYLTTMENSKINQNKSELKPFKLSQIFLMNAYYYDNNFIRIVFFLDKIKNESYNELIHKANYLNYIVDILDEKKEGSLFYFLTNGTNHNIKSISSNFEVVFKSKIEFYIVIELICLENINNIIYLTYEYMDSIIKKAIGSNMQMDRYLELKKKFYLNMKYTDKTFDTMELAKANAESLFESKYDLKYLLTSNFVPWSEDEQKIKDESASYFRQLIPEKSIITIGIRNKDKVNVSCNESCPFYLNCDYFKNESNIKTTYYYNINYTNDTFNFSSTDFERNDKEIINFTNNTYITKHNKSFIGPKEQSNIMPLRNKNRYNFTKFFFKRNVNFSLPKVYISINLFHPYIRPMNSDINESKCYYFKIVEFFSAIQRKIEIVLADAIRAGNEITVMQYIEYLSIDTFCYEDVAFNIIEKIKKIIFDIDWNSTDFISNNEIYKNIVFDEFINYDKSKILDISQYYFFLELKNHVFNRYEFYPDEFDYKTCIQDLDLELDNLKTFIINGYIYGYYTEKEAEKIAELFDTNYTKDNFEKLLNNVNNSELFEKTPEYYVNWSKEIKKLNESYQKNISVKVYNKSDEDLYCYNIGMSFIKFNESELDIYLFKSLLDKVDYDKNLISIRMFKYSDIFLQFEFYDNNISSQIPDDNLLKGNWEHILDKLFHFNDDVDNIGNRYYYVKKNFLSTLFVQQTSLKRRAIAEIEGMLFNGTVLDHKKILDDYNKKYKGKKTHKNELNETIKYYSNITNRTRLDIRTLDE